MYVCIYVCMHVCIYVCMYLCMCIAVCAFGWYEGTHVGHISPLDVPKMNHGRHRHITCIHMNNEYNKSVNSRGAHVLHVGVPKINRVSHGHITYTRRHRHITYIHEQRRQQRYGPKWSTCSPSRRPTNEPRQTQTQYKPTRSQQECRLTWGTSLPSRRPKLPWWRLLHVGDP